MPGTREMTGITLHVLSDGDISGMNTGENFDLRRYTEMLHVSKVQKVKGHSEEYISASDKTQLE